MWKNVYCFCGDPYLIREKMTAWRSSFVKKHGDLNVVHLTYENAGDFAMISQEVESMPFLAPTKLVFLSKMLDKSSRGGEEEVDESDGKQKAISVYQQMVDLCERAPETTILVFLSADPDKRRTLYKNIVHENIRLFEVNRDMAIVGLEDNKRKRPLVDFFLEKLSQAVPRDIVEYTIYALIPDGGSVADLDLFLVESELRKLESYALTQSITVEEVERIIPRATGRKIFDFTDALGFGKQKEALTIMQNLMEQGEDIYSLWNNLIGHFRKLLRVKSLLSEKKSLDAIREYLGKAGYFLDKWMSQAKNFSDEQIRQILARLLRIDVKLKTGGIYVTTTDTIQFQLELEKFIIRASSGGN